MNEIMSYNDLKNHLLSISSERDRAMLCLIYAGMARVGEILRGRYTPTKAMACTDIKEFDNRIELFISTEKTRRPRKVPIFKNRESWLTSIIVDWWKKTGSGPLFDYSTRTGENVFKKWFPEIFSNRGGDFEGGKHTIHWLRGWRYTHYRRGSVTGKRVESKVASLLGGWVSSTIPERFYDFTGIEDFEEELENE